MENKELIEFIIGQSGTLTSKKLQKMVYLIELEYIKKHGERLSNLVFKNWHYGPYSEDIKKIQEEDDTILLTVKNTNLNREAHISKLQKEPKINISQTLEKEITDYIDKYIHYDTTELEKKSKNTEPFLDTEKGEIIDLDGYAEFYKNISNEGFWNCVEKYEKEWKEIPKEKRLVFKNFEDLKEYYSQ